jgi:hypothetical protein
MNKEITVRDTCCLEIWEERGYSTPSDIYGDSRPSGHNTVLPVAESAVPSHLLQIAQNIAQNLNGKK